MIMGIAGIVPMVATNGEDIIDNYSTLTIIIICIIFKTFYNTFSMCKNGVVTSTKIACHPELRECT